MNKKRVKIVNAAIFIVIIVSFLSAAGCASRRSAPLTIRSGETAKLGGIQWTVVSSVKTREVGPEKGRVNAKGWFMVLDLSLANSGNEKIKLKPEALVLDDAAGQKFSIDKKATDAYVKGLANPEVASVFSASIAPGAKKNVAVVYAISEKATKLSLKINGSSIGADRDLQIDLGF